MARKPSKLDQAVAEANGTVGPAETGTEIATFAPDNPVAVFQSGEQFESLLGKIRETVKAHVPDTSTKKGRDAIKSLAFKVVRTRTTLDAAGKTLNEDKRAEIDAVDAQRREIREKLEALETEARRPLDDWEAAETKRLAEVDRITGELAWSGATGDETSADIQETIERIEALELDADILQEQHSTAFAAKVLLLERLRNAHSRAVKAEADAVELERLREQERQREAREAEEQAERDEAERVRLAEAQAAADKRDAETREAERLAEAASVAASAAREETEREAQAKIDAANAETERLRKIQAAADAETKRLADEQEKRDADRAHRGKVMKAAKEAIIAAMTDVADGATDDATARAIVLAIVAGEIPNVKLTF